jgi:YidC/Oxa1 family membrane protein insertase
MIGVNFLNVGYFDGEDAEFIPIKKLTGGKGFLGIGASDSKDVITETARIEWSSVKNQFFASVLSSETVAGNVFVYPVEAPSDIDNQPGRLGISGSVGYELGTLAAGESKSLDFQYFVGPKEFKRLQAMGNEQDLVMQFGFLGFFSKLLLAFMYLIHSVVPSWGWSIVIMTICIKLLFWPLTAKASRSQKRMASIQGPMAELKEKYKDKPQKMQQETLKLFKEHQVNPVAGCLPMLIQMPIFLGLFYMLRTASELRFESFLWVSDLSLPDTQFVVGGFPINILPMIMGVTMFLQMSMMPVSPTADPMQQKIFKFLPFIFLIFLYNFSSGLVLYWTVQNILTVVQQKIINSRPDEPLKPVVATAETKPKGKGGAPRTKPKRK